MHTVYKAFGSATNFLHIVRSTFLILFSLFFCNFTDKSGGSWCDYSLNVSFLVFPRALHCCLPSTCVLTEMEAHKWQIWSANVCHTNSVSHEANGKLDAIDFNRLVMKRCEVMKIMIQHCKNCTHKYEVIF